MNIKKIIGYIIYIFHLILQVIIIYLLFFSNNIIILNIILILLIATIIQWHIFNTCILRAVESHFLSNKSQNFNISINKYSEFIFFDHKIIVFDHIYKSPYIYIFFILILISIIKINYLYNKKLKL
jgi:hypothetical protein